MNKKYPDEARTFEMVLSWCRPVFLPQEAMLDFADWIDKFATADGTT